MHLAPFFQLYIPTCINTNAQERTTQLFPICAAPVRALAYFAVWPTLPSVRGCRALSAPARLREGDHGRGVAPEPLGPQLGKEGESNLRAREGRGWWGGSIRVVIIMLVCRIVNKTGSLFPIRAVKGRVQRVGGQILGSFDPLGGLSSRRPVAVARNRLGFDPG